MPRIGRRAFFLAFSEKGLGDPIIRKVYGDTEHDICEAEPLITFIREPLELAEHFSNIRMALTPAHDLNKTQKNSANRIIDEILRA